MKTQSRFFALGICTALMLFLPFSSTQPAYAQSQTNPIESLLKPDGTINTTMGVNGALNLSGWNVTLDSKRGPILTPQKELLAPPQVQPPDQWWVLPHRGLNNTAYALAVMGIGPFFKVYVGGEHFHTTDGADLGNIAVFDTYNQVWSSLPGGGLDYFECSDPGCNNIIVKSGAVYAFATSGNDLYVGGKFQFTHDGNVGDLNYIAKFNTSANTWSALPDSGLGAPVNALAMIGTTLYVGGEFVATFFGDVTNLNYIAKFSSNTWSPVAHNGLNNSVWALAVSGSDLYVGGKFTADAAGIVTNLTDIAKLSAGAWSAFPDDGLNGIVYTLAVDGNDLYVGGDFTHTFGSAVMNLNRIAKFDISGNTWSALPHHGLSGSVLAITLVVPCESCASVVYVGGAFTQTADGQVTNLNRIAKLHLVLFQGTTWSALPNRGLNSAVNALASIGSDLYVGGAFTQSADGNVTNLNRIAKLAPLWQQFLPFVKR